MKFLLFERARPRFLAAAICATGGGTFYLLHAPLPWMLGSLTAAALTAILGGRWLLPASLRLAARPVVGVLAGSAFSAETLVAIAQWWDAILLVVGQALVVTMLGSVFFYRFAGFDRSTAFFAAAPGGVGEMALLGDSLGGNARMIVVSHLMRILVVVFAVPFIAQIVVGHPIGRVLPTSASNGALTILDWSLLALCAIVGYFIGRAVKFPGALMIVPMLLSIAVHGSGLTNASPPPWLVAFFQVVIGGVVGARFAGINWRDTQRALLCGVTWAIVLIAMAALTAWAGGWLLERSFLGMMLALAPGGMVEMTILTLSVGFEVAFVVTCQLSRILFVLLLAPILFNWLPARAEMSQPAGSSPD